MLTRAFAQNDPWETSNLFNLPQNGTSVDVCAGTSSSSNTTASTSDLTSFVSQTSAPATGTYTNSSTGPSSCTVTLSRLLPRLDALVLVLKTCKADECRNPWGVLHPDGNVKTLLDALNPAYDEFYEVEQNVVHFDECLAGYLLSNELPADVKPYSLDLA